MIHNIKTKNEQGSLIKDVNACRPRREDVNSL